MNQLFLNLFPLVLQKNDLIIQLLVNSLKPLASVNLLLMLEGEEVGLGGQVLLDSAHLHLPLDVALLEHQALLTEL